jgi:hypothetical protein
VELGVLQREPALVLGRRPDAEDLLHGGRDHARVVDDLAVLLGMAGEEHEGVAHQLRDRLGPGPAEERGEPCDLPVLQLGHALPVLPIDLGLGEAADHVVARMAPLLPHQPVEIRAGLPRRRVTLGGRAQPPGLPVQLKVEPVPDLLAVPLGDAEDAGDDLHRERSGELGDRIEAVAAVERLDVRLDHLAHDRLERLDRPRREDPAHQGPEPVMRRWVHHDDAAEHGDLIGRRRQRVQVDAMAARERLPVLVGLDDVVVARQRPEAVALVVVHGRLVPQAPVHVVGVIEEDVGEGVELDPRLAGRLAGRHVGHGPFPLAVRDCGE